MRGGKEAEDPAADNSAATTRPDYSDPNYWETRYRDEESFEWLGVAKDAYLPALDRLLTDLGAKADRNGDRGDGKTVLILGCGNSELSADLHDLGFTSVLSTDISPACIAKMAERHRDKVGLEWKVMDILDLPLEAGSVDIVLEKATLDSFLAGEASPWNLSKEGRDMIEKSLTEISRVLRPSGAFVSLTFAQPHFRLPLYAKREYEWSVTMETLSSDTSFHFFLYTMVKGEELDLDKLNDLMQLKGPKLEYDSDASSEHETEDFLMDIKLDD